MNLLTQYLILIYRHSETKIMNLLIYEVLSETKVESMISFRNICNWA